MSHERDRHPQGAGASRDGGYARLLAETGRRLESALVQPLAPGLYLVATPIGNLADMTLRALAVLARVDIVYCEDTRHSRTLLDAYGIETRTRPYHEHNAAAERPRILEALATGQRIALVSDAGTPLVSDPGFKLVRDAAEAGHRVVAAPGPSAVLAALTVAGLSTDTFLFAGFLPPRQQARRNRIEDLRAVPATLVLFEAPGRTADCLADLAAVLGDRRAVVARELTKRFEEIVRGPLASLAADPRLADPKGEIVILVAPPSVQERAATDDDIRAMLAEALKIQSVRDATKSVAERLAVPKARVYDLAVALRRESDR
jgi:16S rRNA (cytidine1402-2'-O)-methyltransferase